MTNDDIDITMLTRDEAAARIAVKLAAFLQDQLGAEAFSEFAQPVLPALILLALDRGLEVAEATMEGLLAADTYPHWEAILEAADDAGRIALAETARQQCVRDTLSELRKDQQAWTILKTAIGIAASSLLALL